jgi:hypothetical protein
MAADDLCRAAASYKWAYRTSTDDGPPLYRTKPFSTNGDKRAADAVGQGTATATYGMR